MKYKYLLFLIICIIAINCSDEKKAQKTKDISSPKTENFLFVGIYNNSPALMEYDLIKFKSKPVWKSNNEKVIDLSLADDGKSGFMVTAADFGRTSLYPFVNNAKLYLIKPDENKFDFITNLGTGIQVITNWQSDNTYQVILNSIDISVAGYVKSNSKFYNISGKQIMEENRIYDLSKEGFPTPPEKRIKSQSYTNKYSIFYSDSNRINLTIKNNETDERHLITYVEGKVNDVDWSYNDDYLILSIVNISNDMPNSRIIIYSTSEKKIIKDWKSTGGSNFRIIGDLLIYDTGFRPNSKINIYNLEKKRNISTVELKDGCGLNNIPEKPDYDI
ncbi:MAG: hypothetical protein ACM3O3_04795 [Syntrophothermus sp.]